MAKIEPARHDTAPADILVIIAHPDDEIFTSGVICLCVDKGLTVKIVCFTDGEGGGASPPGTAESETLAATRRAELDASARAIGVSQVLRLHLPDVYDPQAPGGWAASDVLGRLSDILNDERPQAILTHGPLGGYGHNAHKMVHKFVMAAVEKTTFGGSVYSFCGKTPGAFFSWFLDQPSDLIFDVSKSFRRRCDSLSHHYSQREYFLQPAFPRTLKKLLSCTFGYLFSTWSFGRKRVPIGTVERFFQRFPAEGLVRQKLPSDGRADVVMGLNSE